MNGIQYIPTLTFKKSVIYLKKVNYTYCTITRHVIVLGRAHYLQLSNYKWKMGQTVVAFPEYLNFIYLRGISWAWAASPLTLLWWCWWKLKPFPTKFVVAPKMDSIWTWEAFSIWGNWTRLAFTSIVWSAMKNIISSKNV